MSVYKYTSLRAQIEAVHSKEADEFALLEMELDEVLTERVYSLKALYFLIVAMIPFSIFLLILTSR